MELSKSLVNVLKNWIEVFMRRSMREMILYTKQNGLSMTQIVALIQIRHKGTCSVTDISEELDITNPAASQLLERLVQQGLVTRSEDPKDRRLKQIELTRQGEMLLLGGLHARMNWLTDLVDRMSPDEQKLVTDALNVLVEKADQLKHQHTPEF